MSMKIYTKTGDAGKTSLIGGTKVPKSDTRIDAYGTIDELNAFIGLVGDQFNDEHTAKTLKEIQDRLFTIGSALACDPDKEVKLKIPDLREEDVTFLEKEIDSMEEVVPALKSFVLPGGHQSVSITHIARCVCRRAERICVGMQEDGSFVAPLIIKYVNRLSDYLFVLSRFISFKLGVPETPWKPRV